MIKVCLGEECNTMRAVCGRRVTWLLIPAGRGVS
jgi:hypothetical protein